MVLSDRFHRVFLWLALIFVVFSFLSIAQASPEPRRVFILNSYHREYSWSKNMLRGIDDVFKKSGFPVETYTFFMDLKRIPYSEEYVEQLRDLIKAQYGHFHFDAVIGNDNDALEFLRRYRDELFPGVPVVFSAINDFTPAMLDGRRDAAATVENADYAGTIALALKLYPKTKSVVVVVDNTTTGRAHHLAVEKITSRFTPDVRFEFWSFSDYTLSEFKQKLSALPKDAIVLLLQHFMDKTNVSYSIPENTPELTASAPVPCFVVIDVRLGYGVLGGHVVSGYRHGIEAGQLALKILGGVNVADIPVMIDTPKEYIFDHFVLRHFNVLERDLPKGSIVLNKPVSLLAQYSAYLITGGIIGILLCVIISILIFYIRFQKRSKKELRETNELFSLFMKHSPIYAFIKDVTPTQSVVLQASDNFLQMLGISGLEMAGKTMAELFPPAFAAKIIADDWVVVSKGEVYKADEEFNGRIYSTIKFPIVRGKKNLLAGYSIDVTESRNAELLLKKAKEDAEIANQAKSELLTNVAHDFRTPMHAILGFSDFLQSENLTDQQKKFASIINARSKDLLRLVEDLLDVSRLESGRLELRSSEFDLGKCVTDAIEVAKVELTGKELLLECFIEAALPRLKGDAVRFNQVFINILDNAVKHTDKGRIVVRVEQEKKNLSNNKCRIRVSIKDTGVGIPKDRLAQIFDAFARFHELEGDKERGSAGFGLYITKAIVDLMEGEITVSSEVGVGSEFIVKLDFDIV